MRLLNRWSDPGSVPCRIAVRVCTHLYRLSVWGKLLKSAPPARAGGAMFLALKRPEGIAAGKSFAFADTAWTYGELLDTLETTAYDTLVVSLRGNLDQLSSGYILFNLCRLEELN